MAVEVAHGSCTDLPPARATQALTDPLPVGGFDRPHLRGVPADVPDV